MKPLKLLLIVLLLAGLLELSSCSKKNDEVTLTKSELLETHTWKLTKIKVSGVESAPDACSLDDVYTFLDTGVYKQDEGPSKCEPSDPQTTTGTWEFTSNETKIKVSYGGGAVIIFEKEIVELTSTTMRLKYNFLIDIEETYTH
jgi:Lipocalin-like domain